MKNHRDRRSLCLPHHTVYCFLAALAATLMVACTAAAPPPQPVPKLFTTPRATVLVDGLINPLGLAPLPGGALLIAEEGTGERDNSAGVTLLTADGRAGRLITNLPSSRDSGDLSGVPLVAVSPAGNMLYTAAFGQGHLWTLPLRPPYTLPAAPATPEMLGETMGPLNTVQLVNPFDLAFAADGTPVVSDASENGIAMRTAAGDTQFIHRFDLLPNSGQGNPQIDPVPTGIARVGDEYFVTLTGGCPYPAGSGRLVAIDGARGERLIAADLNMPIDVAQAADGTIWVLEFAEFAPDASCFSGEGYMPNTGRLSFLDASGQLRPVITELNFPGALAFAADGSAYVSEIFSGRVLHFTNLFPSAAATPLAAILEGGNTELSVASPTVPRFRNVAAERGLTFRHGAFATGEITADPIAMMGGGLCWLDYDKDGWLDLYLVNSHATAEVDYWIAQEGLPRNALFRNVNGRFEAASAGSGADLVVRGNGCVAADFDADGWTDIYITAAGPNALLWNNGDGTFTEGGQVAGVAAPEWSSAASVGDLNKDGWPDLFVASYIDLNNKIENPSGAFPQDYYGLPDHFYLNNGNRTFREVTGAVGLTREERGLGSLLSDLNGDGNLDLYVANDGHPNRVYTSELDQGPNGFHFVDVSLTAGAGDSGSGMGVAGGDYDSDGRIDLLITNWDTELNALYRNQTEAGGSLSFRYSTYRIGISGLGNHMTGWGTSWADFDHDTDEDLLVVNGHVPISSLTADAQLVRLYANQLADGKAGQFREWTEQAGLGSAGVGPLLARGSAVADFDNDGDLDVAVNTIGGAAALLENEATAGNWLLVDLGSTAPGGWVELTLPSGQQLTREQHIGSSYLASEDPRLHFGLGEATSVGLRVVWPNGRITEQAGVAANQVIRLQQP